MFENINQYRRLTFKSISKEKGVEEFTGKYLVKNDVLTISEYQEDNETGSFNIIFEDDKLTLESNDRLVFKFNRITKE